MIFLKDKLYGIDELKDYELQFKGMRDEAALDIYESYPSHYYKDTVAVSLGNKTSTQWCIPR